MQVTTYLYWHFQFSFCPIQKAEKSLMFYRNIKSESKRIEADFQCELNLVKKSFENAKGITSNVEERKITWADFCELPYMNKCNTLLMANYIL